MNKCIPNTLFLITILLVSGMTPSLSYAADTLPATVFLQNVPNDILQIQYSRKDLSQIVAYIKNQKALSPGGAIEEKSSINRTQRLAVWNTYQGFLDHVLALDSFGQVYAQYYKHSKGEIKTKAFRIAYAAFLAQYRYAMDFIAVMEMNPDLHVVLNEPVPEIGLPAGTYSDLKFRFLNVLRGTEFARLDMVYDFYGKDPELALTGGMEEDIDAIWKAGRWFGPVQTLQNGLQILKDSAFTAWFPVQKGVSTLMSKIRVRRGNEFLISQTQIREMKDLLEPGDILLQRREWCLTNIGLPGFWTHAALYVGDSRQRNAFFDDPEVKNWVKHQDADTVDLEALLKKHYPDAWAASGKINGMPYSARVIEAIGEGVVFTTLEHSADADSMAVLRPRLSKTSKARALYRAFHFYGRPYDFNFDFLTDASLVCSELVYKAYLPTDNIGGLNFFLDEMLGRIVLPPNNIARLFDEEYDASPQLDLILFLDGDEKSMRAERADPKIFRKSWQRPKWHIIIKDTLLDRTK